MPLLASLAYNYDKFAMVVRELLNRQLEGNKVSYIVNHAELPVCIRRPCAGRPGP